MTDSRQRGNTHGKECPVRAWVQHIQAFGEAFGQKADAAHGEGQHSGEGARTGYPDENQSVNQKWDGADGNHQQAENRAYWGRSEPAGAEKRKGKGQKRADSGSCNGNTDSLKQQVKEAVFFCGKEKSPVSLQQATYHAL